jgi:hypothetical protein
MPKFNLSPTEARQLVDYFAAAAGNDSPYEFSDRMRATHLELAEKEFAMKHGGERLDHAMQIVANSNYCVKCHLVGDYEPEGSDRAKAPNLADVQFRIRPEYARRWIANPKRMVPYTNMPVNIPYTPDAPHLGGVAQDIYPGTSVEQLDALVDLLLNFSYYTAKKSNVAELVEAALKKSSAPAPPNKTTEGADGAARAAVFKKVSLNTNPLSSPRKR